jgi:hypothetical protein
MRIAALIVLSAFVFVNTMAQNVGINKTNPLFPLDVNGVVNGSAYYINGSPVLRYRPADNIFVGLAIDILDLAGTGNTFVGPAAGVITESTGNFNVAIGRVTQTIGSNNVAIGHAAIANGNNAIAIGHEAQAVGNNIIRLGNTNITAIYAQTGLTVTSDFRKKENFQDIDAENFLAKISGLKVASWNYKGQDPGQFRHYGTTAQEFYNAFGKDQYGFIGNDTTINSQDMDGVMLASIQALKNRTDKIVRLQEENDGLKIQLAKMETEISGLKKDLASENEILKKRLASLESLLVKTEASSNTSVAHDKQGVVKK